MESIRDMEYVLMTYRGWQPDPHTDTIDFIYMFNALQKDMREKRLDPFQYKYNVQPPQA